MFFFLKNLLELFSAANVFASLKTEKTSRSLYLRSGTSRLTLNDCINRP